MTITTSTANVCTTSTCNGENHSMPASSFQNRLTTNIAFLAQFSSEEEGLVASSAHHHIVMIILSS